MDYLDVNGNYDKGKVLEGIAEIEQQIQEECASEVINKSKLTRLEYEKMLRGLYMWSNPLENTF